MMKVNSDEVAKKAAADKLRERLRETAVHEAGHAVIAELLTGASTTITLERRSDGKAVWFDGLCHRAPATAEDARTIALAGSVAQAMVSGYRYSRGNILLNAIARQMSATDRKNAGSFDRHDVDATIRLVLDNWHAIEARAEREIAAFNGTLAAAQPRAPAAAKPAATPAATRAAFAFDDDEEDWEAEDLLAKQPSLRKTALFGGAPIRGMGLTYRQYFDTQWWTLTDAQRRTVRVQLGVPEPRA